jgi:hypothetical protein
MAVRPVEDPAGEWVRAEDAERVIADTQRHWKGLYLLEQRSRESYERNVAEQMAARLLAEQQRKQAGFCEAHQPPHETCACCEAVEADNRLRQAIALLRQWAYPGVNLPVAETQEFLQIPGDHRNAVAGRNCACGGPIIGGRAYHTLACPQLHKGETEETR